MLNFTYVVLNTDFKLKGRISTTSLEKAMHMAKDIHKGAMIVPLAQYKERGDEIFRSPFSQVQYQAIVLPYTVKPKERGQQRNTRRVPEAAH